MGEKIIISRQTITIELTPELEEMIDQAKKEFGYEKYSKDEIVKMLLLKGVDALGHNDKNKYEEHVGSKNHEKYKTVDPADQ